MKRKKKRRENTNKNQKKSNSIVNEIKMCKLRKELIRKKCLRN